MFDFFKKAFNKEIFDFTMRTDGEIEKLISIYLKGSKESLKIGFTSGNMAKGVE